MDDDDDDFDQPLSGSRYRHLVCRNDGRPNGQHCVRHAEPVAAVAETAAPLPSALHQQGSTSEIDAVETESQSIGTSFQAAVATDAADAVDVDTDSEAEGGDGFGESSPSDRCQEQHRCPDCQSRNAIPKKFDCKQTSAAQGGTGKKGQGAGVPPQRTVKINVRALVAMMFELRIPVRRTRC